jgi:hypothetical protein
MNEKTGQKELFANKDDVENMAKIISQQVADDHDLLIARLKTDHEVEAWRRETDERGIALEAEMDARIAKGAAAVEGKISQIQQSLASSKEELSAQLDSNVSS